MWHGGKQIKGRSRHVAVDSQGTLLVVHVTAAKASDSFQAGTVMTQVKDAYPELARLTANQGFRRQTRRAAHTLDCELHITRKRASP